jgi:hypothetical protein
MPTATETEILDKTGFTPKGKDRQKTLEAIARAIDDWCAGDDKKPKSKQNWEQLSEDAQGWYNAAIDAIEARATIHDFEPEDEAEDEDEPEDDEPEGEPEEEDGEEDEPEGDEPEEEADEESEDEDETEDEESEDTEEENEVATAAVSETGRRGKTPPPPMKRAKPKVVEAKPAAKVVVKTKPAVKEAKTNGKAKVKVKVAKPREREEGGISGSEYIRILTIKHPDWTSGEVHAQCKKDGYDVSGLLVSSIRSAAINVCKHLKAEGFRVPKFRQRSSED